MKFLDPPESTRSLATLLLPLVAAAMLAAPVEVRAEVKLARVFGDSMVLQRDREVPVWGTAAAGEEVEVTLGKQSHTIKAGQDGRWRVKLEAIPAGGPHELVVKAANTLRVKDVLFGEVWLASLPHCPSISQSRCFRKDVV